MFQLDTYKNLSEYILSYVMALKSPKSSFSSLNLRATHIFTLEKDFNKLTEDEALEKYVGEIVRKLKTFKVSVHPRIRLFYQLLKRGMAAYAQQTADSLYLPHVYRQQSENQQKEAASTAPVPVPARKAANSYRIY